MFFKQNEKVLGDRVNVCRSSKISCEKKDIYFKRLKKF